MLEQTFNHAEPMPCSVTTSVRYDDDDHPLEDTDVMQAMTIAAFGMDALDVDYFVSDDVIKVESVRIAGVEIMPMLEHLYEKYPMPGTTHHLLYDGIGAIKELVRKQLESEQ